MTVLTFLIKLLLLRVQESRAAKLECCEIHERIWVFLEAFLIVNMFDEIFWWITQWFKKFGNTIGNFRKEKEGIENSGSEEPLQSILLLCFSVRAKEKVWTTEIVFCLWLTMPRVLGFVLKVTWQFRVISPRRCICQSWIVNFRAGVCEKAKNLARNNFSDYEELEFFSEGVRLLTWSTNIFVRTNYPRGAVTKGEGSKILHRAPSGRLENVFSRGQLGLVQEETIVVFYTRMPRETVRQRGRKWRTQEDLALSKHPLHSDWREKLKQSRGQPCGYS